MNQKFIIELVQKYQGRVFELIRESKEGIKDYAEFGKKADGLIKEITNIKLGDLL